VAPSLPSYSAAEIEDIAAATLRARVPGGVVSIPVDVEAVIEADPSVVIDTVRGLTQEYAVEGAVLAHPAEQRFTVIIDEDLFDRQATRARFTLAEEFGHLVLHRELLGSVTSLDDAVALQQHPAYYDQLDRNAKRFAAALLMPPERVREDAARLFIELRAARLGEAALTRALTIRLAQRYAVSPAAMGHRLGEWPVGVQKGIQQAFARGLPALPR
jgi:hypothetical protein